MLSEIQDTGAEALQCARENIWVTFQELLSDCYLQDKTAQRPQKNSHPPIVIVRAQVGRTAAQKETFVRGISKAVARGLLIAEGNVWIHYQEISPNDVWFNEQWSG